MKTDIFKIIALVSIVTYLAASCVDENYTYAELSTDEYPRILGSLPIDSTAMYWGDTLKLYSQYTPAKCNGVWTLNGTEVYKGPNYYFIMPQSILENTSVKLKISVTNGQNTTYREIKIKSLGARQ
jgi:hypothetical protein